MKNDSLLVSRELLERLTNMQPIERDDPNGSGCNLCPECFGEGKWNWKAGKIVSIDPIDHYEKCAIEELRALLAAPVVERQPVAYLDIGAGGYMDLGSDLTDEQLQALPNGRHMLGIVGTYGIDGLKPALAFSTGHPDPVAYATFDDGGKIKIWSRSAKVVEDIARHGEKGIPLYTAPPELAELQVTIERLTAESERLKELKS